MKANHRAIRVVLAISMSMLFVQAIHAQEKVTPETFIRAETDRMFKDIAKNAGGKIKKFFGYFDSPSQEPIPLTIL